MFEKVNAIFAPWESLLKIPYGETGRQWIPEAVAYLIELPFDNLIETFGAKVGKVIAGLILAVAPQHAGPAMAGYAWSERDTEDIHAIAKHLLAEGLDPTPADLAKIAEAIGTLRFGITYGDLPTITRAFGMKSLEEIKGAWDNVARSFATAFGFPTVAGAPPAPLPPTVPVAPPTIPVPPAPVKQVYA